MILGSPYVVQALDTGLWRAFSGSLPLTADDLKFGPHSCDVTLGVKFLGVAAAYRDDHKLIIDTHDEESLQINTHVTDAIEIWPGEFVLGHTNERFESNAPLMVEGREHHFHQIYDGRSTVARLGVISHCTAGYGDFGFDGQFTLEIVNLSANKVRLHAGDRIGQITWQQVAFPLGFTTSYSGAYTDQHNGPRGPVIGKKRFR